MKKLIGLIIVLLLSIALGQLYGQSDSSTVYKNLKTKKFYSVSLSSQTSNGIGTYEVNGKSVSKSTYDKYKSTWKNMETCCPCILKSYNEKDVLIREAVSCTDCGVGWFKTYYLNGRLKLTGSYKENSTGNWDDIWDRGYCSVPNGQWTYFNEKGDTLYSEFWNNGEFVKQTPEQSDTEIWDVLLTLNGQKVDKQIIAINDIGNLTIDPKYKNSNSNSNLTINFEVSAIGYKMNEKQFTVESFKKIDVNSMLVEVGIPKDKKTSFVLTIYSNNQAIKRFYLNVKK